MKKNDTINVYWAPRYLDDIADWNIIYPNPTTLFYDNQIKQTENTNIIKRSIFGIDTRDNFFSCPAVKDIMKNTYIFKNTIECEYEYDFTGENKVIYPTTQGHITFKIEREPSIVSGPLVEFNMSYILFADQPLIATFTAPFFHESKYTKYGSVVPGEFDIGQWFRPFNCEIQLWKNSGSIKFEHDEPLVYVKFNTDKKIKMHRFNINDRLNKIIRTGISLRGWHKTKGVLSPYYYLFNRSSMKDLVLKEIKNNLVDKEYE